MCQSDSPAKEPVIYFPQLDGLRAFAFFIVFIGHCGSIPLTSPLAQGIGKYIVIPFNALLEIGWSGVDLFFVLSAFLITFLLLQEEARFGKIHLKQFFARRILRIWPLYYLAIILGMVLFPFITSMYVATFGTWQYWEFLYKNGLWFALLAMNFGIGFKMANPPASLGPLWSISLEEQFYVCWAFFLKFIRHKIVRLLVLGALWIIAIAMRWSIVKHNAQPIYLGYFYFTPDRMDPIIFGTLIAFSLPWLTRLRHSLWLTILIGLLPVIGFTEMIWIALKHPDALATADTFFLTYYAGGWAIVLIALLLSPFWKQVFSLPPLVHLGRLSYGMYVWHGFVLEYIRRGLVLKILPEAYHNEILILLGWPVTYGVALLSWHVFEKRFYKLKSRFALVKSGTPDLQTD